VLRFYGWLRVHPVLVDSVLGLAVASLGLGGLSGRRLAEAVLFVVALTAPLAMRRRYPVGAFLAVLAAGGLQLALVSEPIGSDVAVLIVLYTLAAYRPRRIAVPGLLACLLGCALAVARWVPGHDKDNWTALGVVLAFYCLFALTAWLLGDMTRWRSGYYQALEERAARLERERDAQARIAAAAEQTRIARELHDVVAHNVSVMVVQADGASYVLDTSPELARTALSAISATGRQALTEMRSLLGVLRSASPGTAGADFGPQPGIEQLSGLLEQARAAGLPVSFTVAGTPRPLPQGIALTAYRVVQESLTNARKHGGAGVTATVTLRYGEFDLGITVTDDGAAPPRDSDGLGHGLIGMRERVELFGGTISAGRRPGGGFQVAVTLPAAQPRTAAA
jgi:signal transduction histidine kinase